MVNNETMEKILKLISKHNYGLTIEDISNLLRINRMTISKYLAILEATNKIKVREVGKAKLHYPRTRNEPKWIKLNNYKSSCGLNSIGSMFIIFLSITITLLLITIMIASDVPSMEELDAHSCTIVNANFCPDNVSKLNSIENPTCSSSADNCINVDPLDYADVGLTIPTYGKFTKMNISVRRDGEIDISNYLNTSLVDADTDRVICYHEIPNIGTGWETYNFTCTPTPTWEDMYNAKLRMTNTDSGAADDAYVEMINVSIEFDQPLNYSQNSTNSTGTEVEHRLKWNDDDDLSGYSLAFDNCTGDFAPAHYMVYNNGLENVAYYGDIFSDSVGNRSYPWGFETWQGDPYYLFNISNEKHSGSLSAKITTNSTDDAAVLAMPEYENKPNITVGQVYRLEAWIKLVNVTGYGVRLIHQWFNSSGILFPEHSVYGEWYNGDSDWIRITLDEKTMDPDNIKGDPVVELWGNGTVYIDDMKFYNVSGDTYTKEFMPTNSTFSGASEETSTIQYYDGDVVFMGANSWINVTKWDNVLKNNTPIFITDVTAIFGLGSTGAGVVTFWTNYTGDIGFCKYDTTTLDNQNITCNLFAAGIDTIGEINNLQLRAKFDADGNANLDMVHITVNYSYNWDADSWTSFPSGGTEDWSNVTKTVNSTTGCTLRWKVYANDSADNWNASEIYSYQTGSAPCSVDFNMTTTLQNGIEFGLQDPDTNISAVGNGFYNLTDLSSSDCATVNISIRALGDLVNGGDSIGIGNVTVNSTSPGSQTIQLSTSYQLMRSSVPAGEENITDLHFWLYVPQEQDAKFYNTTIRVKVEKE